MVNCRGCQAELVLTFLDLGMSPIANNLVLPKDIDKPDAFYPLHVMTCTQCALVQLPEVNRREELFHADYVYFSSYSTTWLEHSQSYAKQMLDLLQLSSSDLVIEVASNDGYLLQYFNQAGVNVMGIEPSAGVAEVAIEKNIPTVIDFFGTDLAKTLVLSTKPRLMLGNNVLAHVPNIHDFIQGFSILLADDGLITFEFPHLMNLIKSNQFDTIYHEHYSYLSVTALIPVFGVYGLKVVKVQRIPTHGGSVRIFVAKSDSFWKIDDSVDEVLLEEAELDPRKQSVISMVQEKTIQVKTNLLRELELCKESGIRVAAYGAAAKGNTLLNYSGVTSELIEYVIDLNPRKQGNFLPGSRIPIVGLDQLSMNLPDVLLVLPWNLASEIKKQLNQEIQNGLKLLRAIPSLEYF
jgi:SAM-dependent methyltransferase